MRNTPLILLTFLVLAVGLSLWILTRPVELDEEDGLAEVEVSTPETIRKAGPISPDLGAGDGPDRSAAIDSTRPERDQIVDDGPFTLHGEVLDAFSEEPVTSYQVMCVSTEESFEKAKTERHNYKLFGNSLGTFTFRKLERGTYNLHFKVYGYEDLTVLDVEVPNPEDKLSLRMSRGAWVDVTVNDFEGDGISDLEVRLNPVRMDDPKKYPRVRLQYTDNHGKVTYTNLPSGTYSVSMENAALADYASEEFYLGPGSNYPVTFTVPELNTVVVQAQDTKENVLSVVQVRMWSTSGRGIFRAQTGADGTAKIRHVPSGKYNVKVYKHGFRRKDQELNVESEGGRDVILKLELIEDPLALEREKNPSQEQLDRLKRGERPADVFKDDGSY